MTPSSTAQSATQATPTDEDLAVLARRDQTAFGLLYDRYADLVFRYCWRRLGTREDAEDATHQVFTQALASIGRFRADSFRSWLFSIAHNVLVDRYRTRREERTIDAAQSLFDPGESPEERVVRDEARRSVHALLAAFPVNERHVVELRLAGLTDKEISEALGLGYGHVRVLQHRAANRFRAQMVGRPEEASHV